MTGEKAERNSGIELIKLLAVVAIIFSHAVPERADSAFWPAPYIMDLGQATASLQRFMIVLVRYGGQWANNIFIVCSAWFLLDGKKGADLKKVLRMMGDVLVCSLIIFGVLLVCRYPVPRSAYVRQLLPTLCGNNWFITCYIVFYLLHPGLNMIVQRLDKRSHLAVCAGMAVMYCGLNFLRPKSLYYSYLVGFVCIYFFVGYMKLYLPRCAGSVRINAWVLALSAAGNVALVAVTDLLGLRVGFLSGEVTRWCEFINPFLILNAMALFNLARRRVWTDRRVNYWGGLSLLVYIIHRNYNIKHYLLPELYRVIYETFGFRLELAWVLLVGLGLAAFGFGGAALYDRTLRRPVRALCDKLYEKLSSPARWLADQLMKLG